MAPLKYPPTLNGLQKTLGAQLTAGATSSATLSNTTGVQNKPGVFIVDRIDANGNELPTASREWIGYSGTSGSTVTTLTRGLGGSSDQTHEAGAVVEFVPDVTVFQAILDALENLVNPSNGSLDTAKVVDLDTAQTLENKTLGTGSAIDLGSDAEGDMLYRNSSGDLARLAIGAATTFLKGGTTPSFSFAFSQVKVGSTTYDISTTGDLAVTGVGFTPKLLILLAQIGSGTNSTHSVGFCTTAAQGVVSIDNAGKAWFDGTKVGAIWITAPSTNALLAYSSFGADGFTLTKSKNSAPTGTGQLLYACLG